MEHKHIKFHEGHITWTGKEKPSEELMEAFEAMYEFIKSHEEQILNLQRHKQDIPAVYGPPPVSDNMIDFEKILKPWTGVVKSENKMEPTIGRIVHFNVPKDMKPKVNYADKLPAMIVRVWSNDCVNLKIITDGMEDIWQTSVLKGTEVNQWEWPEVK